MYRVSAQGVDERMTLMYVIISVPYILLVLVGVSNLFFCFVIPSQPGRLYSAKWGAGGGEGKGGSAIASCPVITDMHIQYLCL